MMRVKVDTHTHTLASSHAYCTVMENARYASEIGMEAVAVTDHAPQLPDAPHVWHFRNLKNIPRELYGVKILYGIELNVLDLEGNVDSDGIPLDHMDVVNASIHSPSFKDGPGHDCTQAYENLIRNQHIDIICHSGNPDYAYDYEKIAKMAAEYHKLIEINNHSFAVRRSSIPNCKTIAEMCKKYGTGIVVTSDAHFCTDIGNYSHAFEMLDEIDFPQELVMNSDLDRFERFMSQRKKLYSWKAE